VPWCTVVLTIAILAALDGIEPAGAAARPKLCKNTYGGDLIYARVVGCPRARHVVRTWARRYRRDGRASRRVFGFRCRGRNDEIEGLVVGCRRVGGRARINFFANVPP
jgi:hypothetical protein